MPQTKVAHDIPPGGFEPRFHWRIIGSPVPVFPGFEIDICDRVPDAEKPDAVWHRERARGLLRAHPEVRNLFGNSPFTAFWCLFFSAAQIVAAIAVYPLPWWGVLLVAYFLGAWINVCLFNLSHECNHGLVFANRTWDRWLFTFTSLPMFLPAHHAWWIEHHVHHNDLGAKKDFVKRRRTILLTLKDRIAGKIIVPTRWRPYVTWLTTPLTVPYTALMLITQVCRSAVGLAVYCVSAAWRRSLTPSDLSVAILADPHLVTGYRQYGIRLWAVTYTLINLAFLSALYVFFGWKPIVYLMMSILFMSGFLHPWMFGLLLSNAHFHGHRQYQPTTSYYGWINWVTFNFGLHTEHHDLASVPWFRLGALRKLAPEFYDPLLKTSSFAQLALQFTFGSRESFDNEDYRNCELLAGQAKSA